MLIAPQNLKKTKELASRGGGKPLAFIQHVAQSREALSMIMNLARLQAMPGGPAEIETLAKTGTGRAVLSPNYPHRPRPSAWCGRI